MTADKAGEIDMARIKKPLVGKNVYIIFENVAKDVFDPTDEENYKVGMNMLKMVTRQVNIIQDRCQYAWSRKTKKVVFMFHFDRPKWAPKVAERAAGLNGAKVTIGDAE